MSRSRDIADLGNVYNDGALSNRSLIINGAMTVAQRGTSQTSQNSSGFVCDRFGQTLSSYGAWTREQSTDAPDGFANSFKLTCTTADTSPSSTNYTRVAYIPEAQDLQVLSYGTSNAKDVTVSFWVKSNVSATYVFWMYQVDSPTTRQINKLYTINAVDTWEYKTITIEGDTLGNIANDTGSGMILGWILSSGSGYTSGTRPSTWTDHTAVDRWVGLTADVGGATNNYFQITGVQLEVGDTATPFEHRSYSDQLQSCMRYYWRAVDVPSNAGTNRYGFYDASPYQTSPTVYGVLKFPVRMRAAPSFTVTNLSSFRMRYGNDLTPISYNFHGSMNEFYAMPTFVAPTNIAAGRHGWVEARSNSTASFDAEL